MPNNYETRRFLSVTERREWEAKIGIPQTPKRPDQELLVGDLRDLSPDFVRNVRREEAIRKSGNLAYQQALEASGSTDESAEDDAETDDWQ